jgi:hypothetical protein
MRNTIDSIPKDGRFVIVEDESGNEAVVRWSSETNEWVELTGAPSGFRASHWWPIATGGAPPDGTLSRPPGFRFPRLNARGTGAAPAGRSYEQPRIHAPRRHSDFLLFSLILTAGGLLAAIVFGDDLMKVSRDAIGVNAPLKPGIERMAIEMRAAKAGQHAILEAARQNQVVEREGGENAQGARHDAITTGALGRSPADETSERRPARSVDGSPALSNQSALHEPEPTVETAKLIRRASELLRWGDIGAARIVLALAHDNGSAHAAFLLAETYDPWVLSIWKAAGIRADPAKARELYARAYAGGMAQAKERSDALPN